MDLARFESSPVGELVRFDGTDPRTGRPFSHKAYLPNPLPDAVDLERRTHLAINRAMLGIGRLDQALQWIANPTLYIRPAIRREAVSTSALEGTYAAFQDIMEVDVVEERPLSPNVAEVMNFVRAAEAAFDAVRSEPITRTLVCNLQRILVRNTPSDNHEAGQIRESPVIIGPRGCSVDQARFVPPPPGDQLRAGVDDWVQWLERDDDIPLLARIAISHYQFETLHPFTDGNGRIGRLVAMLQLARAGLLSHPTLNISPWLYERRDEYIDHLLSVSQTGRYGPWIEFFCEAIRVETATAVDRIARAQAWRDDLVAKVAKAGIKAPAVHRLADGMVGHPVLTPTWVQHHYAVSYPTANSAIGRLEELGVVREVTGRNYDRVFVAVELLEIFQG